MKRSVLNDTTFSDKHRAEFLYFVFNLSILKAKFKNLAVFANKHKPLGKPLLAMFYTRCCKTFFISDIQRQSELFSAIFFHNFCPSIQKSVRYKL